MQYTARSPLLCRRVPIAFACLLSGVAVAGPRQTVTTSAPPSAFAERGFEPAPKVLLIGLDGVRPDALAAANTPQLDALIEKGAYSDQALAVLPTVSGPNWSSMLTGVTPAKHGVFDNSFGGSNFTDYPHFFARLKEARPGLFAASFVHWTPIQTEIVSGADISVGNLSDAAVAARATDLLLSAARPDVIFLHFDDVDGAGHAGGFSPTSPGYLAAIETTDGHVGTVLTALEQRLAGARGRQEAWLVLVSTDHGGLGTSHGGSSLEERTTFLIASGGAVPPGETLSPPPDIYDIPVTAMAYLGVQPRSEWDLDGESVLDRIGCPAQFLARADSLTGQVTLSWQSTPGGAVGYELFRNGASLALLAGDATSYVDRPDLAGLVGHPAFDYELIAATARPGASCPPLVARAVLSTGDVRLAEDFDDYASDAALLASGWSVIDVSNPLENSTWTVTNPAGKSNPPTFDGRPSAGRFLISDSDLGGAAVGNPPGSGMSHDLRSPPIDCQGLAQVWLHLDCSAQLNNNGEAVFDIDVSADPAGLIWQNVFRRVAPARSLPPFATHQNADGFFGRLNVDLTAQAAGQASVRFRLRHFEPNWDWWIAVDNIIVDDVDLGSGGALQLFASEGFANGIPGAWTLVGLNSGTETWHTTDKGLRYLAGSVSERGVNRIAHPGPTPDFAMLESDANPDPIENEHLITPAIDCSTMGAVYLHFQSETVVSTATQEVLLSLDGGLTFEPEPLFSYSTGALLDPGEEPFYAERVIAAPRAAFEGNVAFAFRFASPGNTWWWAVDEVRVTGTPGP